MASATTAATFCIRPDFASQALSSGSTGLAARYALKQLRYVAIDGIDYSAKNANGELNLYDEATGHGEITRQYIQDRTAMLGWLVKAKLADKLVLDGTSYGYGEGKNWEFSISALIRQVEPSPSKDPSSD